MKAKYRTVTDAGSCNFCNDGELSLGGYNIIFPYTHVYEMSGSYLGARVCDTCLEDLIILKENIDSQRVADKLSEC